MTKDDDDGGLYMNDSERVEREHPSIQGVAMERYPERRQ